MVVSWVGFLIPPEVVPGRMAMLITLFLVLTNIFNIVTTNSPNVEGMTAIAAWMLVCIFFVFGALVGYAYLLWTKKKSCFKRKKANKQGEEKGKKTPIDKEKHRSKVDAIFLLVFPIMFLLFNLTYWPLCLSSTISDRSPSPVEPDQMDMDRSKDSSPILNEDKRTTHAPAMGLPLGIYTIHNGRGCRRDSEGSYNENCKP